MGNSNGKPVVLTDEVNLNHFKLLRVVGKGAFGKVRIVERKDTGLQFALKYIRKDEIVRSESVRNIIRERRMLEHLKHPFVGNLRYSFQDMEYLYLVVDLMMGGDLRFNCSRRTFTEEAVRFWMAELACALRYVHSQGIVHRDVKPDNCLLDIEGHVHLADFNVASDYTPGKLLTSKSGTMAYLAPEVYVGKGYSTEVDWWSLGVTFYECIYNKRPFDAGTHEATAQLIIKADTPFPVTSPPVSMVCNHAISSLLEKDKNSRIGAAGFETFTDNPFFREIDFEALERLEIEPVFVPSVEKTNFDATYDLEELLLEEAPLEARTRRQRPRAELRNDATQQEIRADEQHRMVETMFLPFNYTTVSDNRPPVSAADLQVTVPKKYARSERSLNIDPNTNRPRHEHPRSIPTSRSQTPATGSRTVSSAHSVAHSANGSPPLPSTALSSHFALPGYATGDGEEPPLPSHPPAPTSEPMQYHTPQQQPGSTGQQTPQHPQNVSERLHHSRTVRYEDTNSNSNHASHSATGSSSRSTQQQRPRGSTRSTSMGGGAPVVLNEQGNWSETANSSQGMVDDPQAQAQAGNAKPATMLGFLSRKGKGREKSPKGKHRERGVLGKEGARHIISHG